jgi:hypothetical protein
MHVISVIPVPLQREDARMRLPGPHDAVQGMHTTGKRLPSPVHAAEARWPAYVCVYEYMCVCVLCVRV